MAESQLTASPILTANESVVEVSPNPTMDVVNVKISAINGQAFTLSLCDITGQELYREKGIVSSSHVSSISLAAYSGSIYFLHVEAGNKQYNQKVVKGN
jgi:hypothetical protein